jgi:hypothetical protein
VTELVNDGAIQEPGVLTSDSTRYISDIAATRLKPLFIAGCTITVVFLDLAFLAERWLRHSGRLASNKGRFDKFCSIASILASIVGAVGLIGLSVFDIQHYSVHRHDTFLAIFM